MELTEVSERALRKIRTIIPAKWLHTDGYIHHTTELTLLYSTQFVWLAWFACASLKCASLRSAQLMRGLSTKIAEEVYQELGCAIIRANKITDIPGTAADMAIEQKCRGMLKSCAGPRLDPLAEEALWLLKKDEMADVVQQAEEVSGAERSGAPRVHLWTRNEVN